MTTKSIIIAIAALIFGLFMGGYLAEQKYEAKKKPVVASISREWYNDQKKQTELTMDLVRASNKLFDLYRDQQEQIDSLKQAKK